MPKKILVAPLNWGLGHATRCIPIINALIENGFQPILASDGVALMLLKKEFPGLEAIELPTYNITYAKKGPYLKFKLLKDAPKLIKTIKAEKRFIENLVNTHAIDGIISDNRLGVYNNKVPSVFLTHQLNVLSGNTTWLSTKLHQKIIRKFNECWVPDTDGAINLSGKLGHTKGQNIKTKYIGPLSRFIKKEIPLANDVMVLLSGPEPQRTFLEEKLLKAFENYKGKVVFVKGIMEQEQSMNKIGSMTVYNFMTSELLGKTLNESNLIVSRSGYTTIMDLAKLNKNAFFIPTPGQFEQEYLAKRLTELGLIASCKQDEFVIDMLEKRSQFKGLSSFEHDINFKELFSLFERE